MTATEQNRLTRLVKRFLDLMWYLLLFGTIAWTVTVLIVGLNIPADPAERHTDVNVFLSFKVFPDVAVEQAGETTAKAAALISGRSELYINNTHGRQAWYLAGGIEVVMALIGLFGLMHMRKLFTALAKGDWFIEGNNRHIEILGYVFIAWHIIRPLLQYFGGRMILNDINLQDRSIQLLPSFEFNLAGIFTGFAILVLAAVLREAVRIHRDQALTI